MTTSVRQEAENKISNNKLGDEVPQGIEVSPSQSTTSKNWSEVIEEIDLEMKRINWSVEIAQNYLQKTYGGVATAIGQETTLRV